MRPYLVVAPLAALALAAGSGLVALPGAAGAVPVVQGGALLATPGVHVTAKPGHTPSPLPNTPAASWVLADDGSGAVLAAKNAHLELRPASTLKTLTAVTLLPRLDPNRVYTPVYSDVTPDGSKVGIVNGSRYTINQLWYGLFLASGNDTAHALARANGGITKTVDEMNAEARILHADDTVAKTPSGLDAKGQHSSAYDLALITRAGLQIPAFRKYCGTLSMKFPRAGTKAKRSTFMVYNHNPLLLGAYPGVIGVKTGYTTEDDRTFIGAATRHGRTLIVTLMDYPPSADTYTTAANLLNWGFKNATKVTPVGQLVAPATPATTTDVAAKAKTAKAAGTTAAHKSSHHLLLPFLILLVVILVIAWLVMRGAGSSLGGRGGRDPLAAANKGLGRSRSSTGPRGRGGPRSY